MKPGEHKTCHPSSPRLRRTGARILACAEAIRLRQGYGGLEGYCGQVGWTIVSREKAEERKGGLPAPLPRMAEDRNAPARLSLFFKDLLDANLLTALVAEPTHP